MAGAKGSALDWALALLDAPGERHALRAKPLPPGVDSLLAVAAGGSIEPPDPASTLPSVPEARLREAARFYAREVLFFPQADAYRTLGVAPDASAEQIKAHHRLLQHWLHPDRLQGDDDAVFAGRINSAWNRLRSPDRRAAYDEARRQARPPELFDSSGSLRAVPAWEPLAEPPPAGLERWRHRVPGLMLGLACLVLAVMVLQDMGQRPDAWEEGEGQAPLGRLAQGLGLRLPERAAAEERADATANAPRPRQSERDRGNTPRANARSAAGDAMVGSATSRAPRIDDAPRPAATRPVDPLAVAPSALAAAPVAAPTASTAPRPAPSPATSPTAAPPAGAQVVVATPIAAAARPVVRRASAVRDDEFLRSQSARQVGEQLLRYMAAANHPPPPIWNSPAIQSSAEQLRRDLHEAGKPALAGPQWRIGQQNAVLTSRFDADASASGAVTADLVWREGHWLVTGVSVERFE